MLGRPEPEDFSISIHAPSRERPITAYQLRQCKPFQSTLPHGSDRKSWALYVTDFYFNPRSLTGATEINTSTFRLARIFQSTLPHGSDLYYPFLLALIICISIHAPSRERPCSSSSWMQALIISIHAPSRERPSSIKPSTIKAVISIHAPSRERPALLALVAFRNYISIHAPSRERPGAERHRP